MASPASPLSFTPPDFTTQHWHLAKPAARGRRGMVASQSRAAAEAGLAVLEAGGNAADAAAATALALAALEPWNSGLGGIGFAVIHRAGSPTAEVLDFGPVAPAASDPADYPLTGRMKQDLFAWPEVEGDRNIHGPLSFVIPSAVAGYGTLAERFGSGMAWADLVAPAIALARRGLPQDWFTTLKIANSAKVLRLYPESARIYLPDGLPPVAPYQGKPGFFRLGRLPETLERLGAAGWRDFYEGEVAASIAADVAAMGGRLSLDDLRGCRAVVRPALSIPWRGRYTLQGAGGLTAAPTLARVVAAMEATTPGAAPDATWFAALASAMRRAYAERLEGLGAGTVAHEATPPQSTPPEPAETCTTHLTVVDAAGNMVAMTTTLLSSMGSRVVLPGSGVLMNNGMMWFDPQPGSANAIRPGARPLCNMCPVTVSDGAGPVVGPVVGPMLAAGASGGRRILASVYQSLAFALDFGMAVEEVAHHPRIDVSGPDGATADRRLPPAVLAALEAQGGLQIVEHAVLPVNFACPNLILREGDGHAGISDAMSPWSAALALT
ncbi:gamma-glutamyltransferase [Roseomonas sp. GC11]|uniref:gamma-glutamyltransferase n=1 Tax=Roseomonas sp. GC11 TaxID=2950546 RepID=UPI002108FDED|nr:gamma-glutamyltransferase [Roseomonas sp. GC11]MCQ4158492.1 gamma-glutamyltransferase [Roseomonas sp. GC11]